MKTSAAIARSVVLALAMGFGGGLFMASTTPASASSCAAGGYNTYNPAPPGPGPSITCTIDNLSFSSFMFNATATGGATLITPSGVTVTPITTLGNEGFDFNPGLSVTTQTVGGVPVGQTQDVRISFEVTALNGATIDDLSIFFNGSFSGTGSTIFSETYCTGGFGIGCNIFQVQNPPTDLSKEINLPAGITTLFITKDVSASSGTGLNGVAGSAGVSEFDNQFSNASTPIPGALPLFATGLVGLWGLRRKRKQSAVAAA